MFLKNPELFKTKLNQKRGYGDNLIWARMNIYENNDFDVAYNHPPTLTIKDHVHVGVEVKYKL